ncbi:MAG: hypothetical protein MJE77_42820 [Proteobacteria bacterium]|nr:hypothetical protein [Pseudomonadota bacterium]
MNPEKTIKWSVFLLTALMAFFLVSSQAAADTEGTTTIDLERTDTCMRVTYQTTGKPNDDRDWIGIYEGTTVPAYEDLGKWKAWDYVKQNATNGVQTIVMPSGHRNKDYVVVYFKWEWTVAASALSPK